MRSDADIVFAAEELVRQHENNPQNVRFYKKSRAKSSRWSFGSDEGSSEVAAAAPSEPQDLPDEVLDEIFEDDQAEGEESDEIFQDDEVERDPLMDEAATMIFGSGPTPNSLVQCLPEEPMALVKDDDVETPEGMPSSSASSSATPSLRTPAIPIATPCRSMSMPPIVDKSIIIDSPEPAVPAGFFCSYVITHGS